jgi:hypothetical protein
MKVTGMKVFLGALACRVPASLHVPDGCPTSASPKAGRAKIVDAGLWRRNPRIKRLLTRVDTVIAQARDDAGLLIQGPSLVSVPRRRNSTSADAKGAPLVGIVESRRS